MDDSILQQLKAIQTSFFNALEGDAYALQDFDKSWGSFSELVQSQSTSLCQETLASVFSFSSVIDTISSGLLSLQESSSTIYDRFSSDLDGILEDEVTYPAPGKTTPSQATTPAYVEPASAWLLNNLHCPYPSSDVRTSIALQSHCCRKDIDSWFIDARKRIGWNDLRKKHFNNKRADIVDAATRFFLGKDPHRSLAHVVEGAFVSIETKAQSLYYTKFKESTLASKLDQIVKDMTPDIQLETREGMKRRKFSRNKCAYAYPTPESSPEVASDVSLPNSPSECSPSPPFTRKRELSCTLPSDEEDEISHRTKRVRLDTSFPSESLNRITAPPSPTLTNAENDDLDVSLDLSPRVRMADEQQADPPSRKRKRDSSESISPREVSDTEPQNRAPVTSDPLASISLDLEGWLQENFGSFSDGVPEPVIADSLDRSLPLEVEVVNLPPPHYQPCSTGNASTAAPAVTNLYHPQTTEISSSAQTATDSLNFLFNNIFDQWPILPSFNETDGTLGSQIMPNSICDLTSIPTQLNSAEFWFSSPAPSVDSIPQSTPYSCTSNLVDFGAVQNRSGDDKAAKQRELLEVQTKYFELCAELAATA